MKATYDDLPFWEFEVIEFTPGGYRVKGAGPHGLEVEFQGNDPEALLERAKNAARELAAAVDLYFRDASSDDGSDGDGNRQ